MKRMQIRPLIALALIFLLSGCAPESGSTPEEPPAEPPPPPPAEEPLRPQEPEIYPPFPEAEQVRERYAVIDALPGLSFVRPLDIQQAGDDSGRLFVVEQGGLIHAVRPGQEPDKAVFLDIRDRIDDSGNEMGLLGLAFHPAFSQNGRFYVNYTDGEGTVVARFRASGDQADPDSEERILTFAQPFSNHNGGQLAFGPDGFLYIATGDGGGSGDPLGHSQNRETLHGNILRIDVNRRGNGRAYAIPPDNPFAGNQEGFREEIYAWGLRNPWRFSFDPPTGRLFAADVGQNAVEEINLIEKGGNYGWNIMEGTLCYRPPQGCDSTGLELPVHEYLHPVGRSVTGGYVYRGTALDHLQGAYVYGDFITGLVWGLWVDEEGNTANHLLVDTDLRISSFGLDENAELYLSAFDGRIYRLVRR